MTDNRLYLGDNLDVLRAHIEDESVDLVYLDPPFNSRRNYTVRDPASDGANPADRAAAFDDTWRWDAGSATAFDAIQAGGPERAARVMRAFRTLLGESDLLAYLTMMAPRLVELRRGLQPAGSLYLHCDPGTSAVLRLLLDAVFGSEQFRNEIVWHYTGGGRSKRYFSRKHDVIFWYGKSPDATFNIDAVRTPYKQTSGYAKRGIVSKAGKTYLPHPAGTPVDDVWYIPMINPLAKERLGYPTQKPEALLERIVLASSHEGQTVLDPFCGSGTTLAVAERLGRRWIGIDRSRLAIEMTAERLGEASFQRLLYHLSPEAAGRDIMSSKDSQERRNAD